MPDQTIPTDESILVSARGFWNSGSLEKAKLLILGLLAGQTVPSAAVQPPTGGDATTASSPPVTETPDASNGKANQCLGSAALLTAFAALWFALADLSSSAPHPIREPEAQSTSDQGAVKSPFAPTRIKTPLADSQPLLRVAGSSLIAFGNTQKVHVVHAVNPPTLNGVLDVKKWDQATKFHGSLPAPYSDRYYIDGYMQMDDTFLWCPRS